LKSLKHLNKYLFKYRYRLGTGIFFIIVSNLFAIYPPQIARYAIDYAAESRTKYILFPESALKKNLFNDYSEAFLIFLLLIVFAVLMKGLFMFFMRQTIIVMSRLIEYDLKNEIYEQYQRLDLSFYKRNNTGDLMARISEDVSQVRMYLGPAIMYTINLAVLVVLTVTAMVTVNAELTFYVLLPLPFLGIGIYYVSQIINKKSSNVQGQLSKLATFVQETFSGIRVIKSFAREDSTISRFSDQNEKYKSLSLSLVRTEAIFQPLILLLVGFSTLITIYIGGQKAISGSVSLGNIAEFVMYVNMLTWPVATVGWVTSIVQKAAASQTRINEFLQITPEIINQENTPMNFNGHIRFNNVSFDYKHSGIQALKGISFEVLPGKSLGILGRTGAGKSTIAQLLNRLYDVKDGEILIDGKNIKSVNLYEYRNCIGYVPQEVFLFSDTIANNIAWGLKGKTDFLKIEQAAKDAAIQENIKQFPSGFETFVGERGIILSGGQKQRVSIARAIIKDPTILIFDDCLSAVDTGTEEKILQNLKRVMKDKTTLIISHRVSTVKSMDHIIFLDDGNIIEEGNHEKLIAKQGKYWELFQKQLLENQKLP